MMLDPDDGDDGRRKKKPESSTNPFMAGAKKVAGLLFGTGKNKYQKLEEEDAALARQAKAASRGPLVHADGNMAQQASKNIGDMAAHVTNVGLDLAVAKLVGENLKEGLPISFKRHVLINCGQILTLTSDIIGLFPVLGEAAAAPFTMAGETTEQIGRGYTGRQAVVIGGQVTGTAAATGAIPFAGTVISITNLCNDFRNLCTPVAKATKQEAIEQMRVSREKAREILVLAKKAAGSPDIDQAKADQICAQLQDRLDALQHYIEKYNSIIVKKLDKDTTPLLKYSDYVLEDPNDETAFNAFIDSL